MTNEEIYQYRLKQSRYQEEVHGPLGGIDFGTQNAIIRMTDYIQQLEKRIEELEHNEDNSLH